MGTEIERKFLVLEEHPEFAKALAFPATPIAQGYLSLDPDRTVRARVKGDQGYLTIKGARIGISCEEFEYEIPASDALRMIETLSLSRIIKTRREIPLPSGHVIELDHFTEFGFYLAEIELASEGETPALPDWFGEDVSCDPAYTNAVLSQRGASRV